MYVTGEKSLGFISVMVGYAPTEIHDFIKKIKSFARFDCRPVPCRRHACFRELK